jgi:colanic acid/amylovoran biosynthesis glycosyltransferase
MLRIARRSHRRFAMHLASLAEAAVLVRWTEAQGAQHIHAHFGTNSAEVALLARLWGSVPYSLTLHGSDEWDRPLQWALLEKVEHAAFVVAISSFTRAQLMRWIRLADHDKLHVVHCGVDESFLQSPATPVPDVQRFVCVGRLCNEKAQPLLIEALALLRERGLRPHLVLAGDGELRKRVQALIAQHGLGDQVTLTGWIDGEHVRSEIVAARAGDAVVHGGPAGGADRSDDLAAPGHQHLRRRHSGTGAAGARRLAGGSGRRAGDCRCDAELPAHAR